MRVIKFFSYKVMPLFSGSFFLTLLLKIKYIRNLLYSGFIYGQLKKSGKDPLFCYPVSLYGGRHITIGDNFFTQPGLRIEALEGYGGDTFTPKLSIGNNVVINDSCHIACINEVTIKDNVLIASRVFITDHFHGRTGDSDYVISPSKRRLYSRGPVVINNNVWLGEGVIVMPGVTIGAGAVIGANSVVTKDVPPYCVFAGVPARFVKQLNTGTL